MFLGWTIKFLISLSASEHIESASTSYSLPCDKPNLVTGNLLLPQLTSAAKAGHTAPCQLHGASREPFTAAFPHSFIFLCARLFSCYIPSCILWISGILTAIPYGFQRSPSCSGILCSFLDGNFFPHTNIPHFFHITAVLPWRNFYKTISGC